MENSIDVVFSIAPSAHDSFHDQQGLQSTLLTYDNNDVLIPIASKTSQRLTCHLQVHQPAAATVAAKVVQNAVSRCLITISETVPHASEHFFLMSPPPSSSHGAVARPQGAAMISWPPGDASVGRL